MACPQPQNNQSCFTVVWVVFLMTSSGHLVVADTFDIHFLPGSSVPNDTRFAAAAIAVEDFTRDYPNSSIFVDHEVR